ncbi:MAG: ABC transporter substrate-binding protein [Chloroflexota bacterium]
MRWSRTAQLFCWTLVVGLLVGIVGCEPAPAVVEPEPSEPVSPAVDGVLRLGILGPFSGPSESTGDEFRNAVTMAFDAVDWHIGDYEVQPVWIDSQSDPDIAVQAYETAVTEDGIQAAILNWHSSVAVACMDVAAEYQIPHIFPYGATEVVNEKFHSDPDRYGYWMNKGWPVSAKLTTSYVQAVEDAIDQGHWVPEEKTLAICAEDTHWGRSFGDAIRSQLEAEGWTTVAEDYVSIDEVEFWPTLNKFQAQDVALVAATTTSMPSFAAFINQADEIGLQALIIADGLGWGGEWYHLTGDSSDYVVDQIPGWATVAGRQFAEAYQERWGLEPSSSAAGLAYDGTNMFIEIARNALDEYGELSSQTIYRWGRDYLQTGEWSYTDGIVMEEYRYTPETLPDPVVGEGYYMFPVRQYFDGEGKIIYPPEWAEQELQPRPTP